VTVGHSSSSCYGQDSYGQRGVFWLNVHECTCMRVMKRPRILFDIFFVVNNKQFLDNFPAIFSKKSNFQCNFHFLELTEASQCLLLVFGSYDPANCQCKSSEI
jgi:hypothetical protein